MPKFRPSAFSLLLASVAAAPAPAAHFDACRMETGFQLDVETDRLVFTQDHATPSRIVMASGRLYADGAEVELGRADRARLRKYEAGVRDLVPEVKAIALEAVAITRDVLVQVAESFGGDRRTLVDLRRSARTLEKTIADSHSTRDWDDRMLGEAIAALVADVVPRLVGEITASAVRVALSGDEAAVSRIEAQARKLEQDVEAAAERRAGMLESRAQALCPRLEALDALESSFEAELPGGGRLDLLRIEG